MTDARGLRLRAGLLWFMTAFLYYLMWAWIIPLWQAPDEPLHYEYAAALSLAHRPLSGKDIDVTRQSEILASLAEEKFWHYLGEPTPAPLPKTFAESPDPYLSRAGTQIGDEPPLYYIVPALVMNWLPTMALRLRLMRIYSAMLSALIVPVAWATSQELWPDRPDLAIVAASWVMLLPMASFIGASANNDALVNLVSALFTWLMVRSFRRGWSGQGLIAAGLLLILLPLSQKLGLALMPAGVLAIIWALSRRLKPTSRRWGGVVLGALVLLLAGFLLWPVPEQPAWWGRRGLTRYGARTSMIAHDGKYAFVLPYLGAGAPPWIVQTLPEASARRLRDHTLTLRAWVRAADVPTEARFIVDDGVTPAELVAGVGPEWQKVTLSLGVAAEASQIRVVLTRPEEVATGTLYFDGVSLTGLDREWLANGSAEVAKRRGEGLAAKYLRLPPWFLRGILDPASYDTQALRRFALYSALLFPSFWANFGWLTVPLPIWAYVVIALVCGMALGGWRHGRGLWARPWQRRTLWFLAGLVISMGLAVLLPMIGRDWQPQGRYLFPVLVPLALGWVGGWAGWGKRWGWRHWWLLPVAFMLILSLGTLLGRVVSFYYS